VKFNKKGLGFASGYPPTTSQPVHDLTWKYGRGDERPMIYGHMQCFVCNKWYGELYGIMIFLAGSFGGVM